MEGDRLIWSLALRNETEETVEIGDIGLPLPFNRRFVRDNLANYTQVVARHSFISGHGSFLFWQRPNGAGPYLVMTPLAGTKLEYYEEIDPHPSTTSVPYRVYIHSAHEPVETRREEAGANRIRASRFRHRELRATAFHTASAWSGQTITMACVMSFTGKDCSTFMSCLV